MKIEHTEVFNFEGALRGMRNPKNSWNRCDSHHELEWLNENEYKDKYVIGPNDMKLAQALITAGPEHRKFLRQILVSVDITAPLYVWKEIDTYKIATVANSTSTMHKLTSKPITLDCFEIGDYDESLPVETEPNETTAPDYTPHWHMDGFTTRLIKNLEELRLVYLETKDTAYWKELVRWLPESWLQTRTMTMNYETLRSMYGQRKNHKLVEWHFICDWIESLPYAKELITYIGEKKDD